MGQAQSQYRSFHVWIKEMEDGPPSFPTPIEIEVTGRDLKDNWEFVMLKNEIAVFQLVRGFPRGEMNLLASTEPNPKPSIPKYIPIPFFSSKFEKVLRDTIRDHTEWGTMREQSKGLSHPDTLYSYLLVAQAHYLLGHFIEAKPLFEQVFMLNDRLNVALTIRVANILRVVYYRGGYRANLRAFRERALAPLPSGN